MELTTIKSIPKYGIELLEAIGCLHLESLAKKEPVSLLNELLKANELLSITSRKLEPEKIQNWITAAQKQTAKLADKAEEKEVASEKEPTENVNLEEQQAIIDCLKRAPQAELLNMKLVKDAKLSVSDIAEGILLSNCDEEQYVQTKDGRTSLKNILRKNRKVSKQNIGSFRDFDSLLSDNHPVAPLSKGAHSAINASSDGLNRNVPPSSRRFIKGVLHANPERLRRSAIVLILLQFAVATNIFGIPYFIIAASSTDTIRIDIILSLIFFVFLAFMAYLIWGSQGSCRVCGQKQFIPKHCIKHKKAHHTKLFGYMLPTAIQLIVFKWFYCIFCGTAIRLKK
ncbi:MAG: hypothetical protein ACSHX0_13810 [Akkermansiaceae bacterium]